MQVELDQLWDGSPAPNGLGGKVFLERLDDRLCLTWELQLADNPGAPAHPAGFTDGLWEWDVLELFLRSAGAEGPDRVRYLELELGPAGHWLAFSFQGVRHRVAALRELEPSSSHQVDGRVWRGRAEWPVHALEAHAGPAPWSGLITAVFGSGADRAFLSCLKLPGARPDFHQPDAWMPIGLELE